MGFSGVLKKNRVQVLGFSSKRTRISSSDQEKIM